MTHVFFNGWEQLLRTIVVGLQAHASLVLLRVSGKRTLSKMSAFDFIVTIALGSTLAASATSAQDAVTPVQPEPAIATQTKVAEDAAVAARIRSIFDEIESLQAIQVRVSAGVVTLSGTAANVEESERAKAIASRVAGVVTVQNNVTRNLDVDTNLAPALGQFGEDMRALVRALPLVGAAIGIAMAIVLLGYLIASADRMWRWITPNAFMAELVATSLRLLFIILGLIAALEILGATALLGAVLGGAGVIGIALGFAVRDTVDNYVSSLMLSLRQPFRANDHVVIEANEGRVVRLTSRATILMTLDGNHLRIPNSTVFKAVILNYTRNPQRRFQFDLGVDADDDPVRAMSVGLGAVNQLDFVLDRPKASAIIQEVGDSNILLRFFGWVDQTQTDFLKGRSLAIQAAKSTLETAGFALPEPIYRLRFDDSASLPLPLRDHQPASRAAPGNAPHSPIATPMQDDTQPDAHVAQLVRQERAEGGKDDLLDDRRPTE
ncbi:MAG: mechanosensitive ion channel [Pseudomonadota bacterium]|nr:mechanosensitive ion channel [Pseudomonadota bacterium]